MTLASLPTTAWAAAFFLPLLAAAASPRLSSLAGGGAVALLTGLVVVSGEPAIAGEILVLAAVFVLAGRARGGKAFAGGAALGLAIAAPQIVAAAALFRGTVRGSGLAVASGAAFYSVRPARFFAVLWPGLFGDVHSASAAGFWGAAFFDAGAPYVSTLAIGTATLALLPAAWRARTGRRFLLLAALSAVLSLGRFLPGGDRLLALPGLSLARYPEKWLIFSMISAIAAAGFGLDRVREGDRGAARAAGIGAAALAALSWGTWLWLRAAPERAWSLLLSGRVVAPAFSASREAILADVGRELALTGTFAAVLFLCVMALGARPRRLAAALAVLLFLDLFPRTWNAVPLETNDYFDRAPSAAAAVSTAEGRFFFDSETELAADPLRPMRPVMWGIAFAGNNDIDRFSPRRSFLFGRALASLRFSDPRKLALLRVADVRAVSSIDPSAAALVSPWFSTSPRRTVYRVSGASRFRFFASAVGASGEEAARRLLLEPGRDTLSAPVIEGAVPTETGRARPAASPAAIRTLRRRADRETVEVGAPVAGWLFRSETFDRHWKARVDGRPAAVVPADYAFQAVAVPEGRHRVEFVYSDAATRAAMAVSLAALLAAALALAAKRPARG